MVTLWKFLSNTIWDERLWLSSGTWADVANGPDKNILYPECSDFLYQIPLIVIFIILRYVLETYCFDPLGRVLGVKNKKRRDVSDVPQLETAYRKSPQNKDAEALAKQLDMSVRQVESWLRLRRKFDKPSNLTKFCEHVRKVTFYGGSSLAGYYIMWDKDYFWDLDKCFLGHPHQGLTNDVWWFYMIYTAYMWSCVIMLPFDVHRKDFQQMVVHHFIAVMLLTITWITSYYRLGAVIVPLLEAPESILEAAKALKLSRYEHLHENIFYLFTFTWFYSRMYIFPFQIFYRILIRATMLPAPVFVEYLLATMLFALLVLQFYWSFLILQVIYKHIGYGIKRDVRSSSSEVSDIDVSDSFIQNNVDMDDEKKL